MSKITIDAATATALKGAEPGAVLVGPDGQTVGAFVPPKLLAEWKRLLQERERLIDEAFSPEILAQLKAAEAAGGAIPHDEVVKRLGLE